MKRIFYLIIGIVIVLAVIIPKDNNKELKQMQLKVDSLELKIDSLEIKLEHENIK